MLALCLALVVGSRVPWRRRNRRSAFGPWRTPLFGVSSMTPDSLPKVVAWVTRQAGVAG